ncbi:hypothetical protein BO71DRAFT_395968 [Aspergillus ellipticus CBS 707.79]|uniref:Uncharacterized protein n=1 Tax=Aspergillus ellipticus CBS 707.79 TaxID=1448320 RepID=A0A319EAH3_9EURO|nr:hypothetical protein BO71DRAFT_395968 [Aspergillus ellipticus CBS 707.79]
MPNHKDKLDLKPGANMKTTDLKIDTETANKPASSGSSARSTSQPTPSLKLFPDTMPPRISSKNAWRISNVHPLALNRPLPAAPGSQRAVNEPNAERPKPSDNLPRKDPSVASGSRHSTSTDARKSGNDPIRSPTTETFPHKKSFRRPSSLPMCTIDAFPLPAPMRPLPSLPESTPPITIGDRNATGKSAPPERLVLDGKNSAACMQDEPTIPEISSGPSLISFVRAGQSRAERVHALKLRDMSASRLYLKESETPQEEGTQLPEPKKDSRVPSQDRVETQTPSKELESPTDGNRRYQRKVAAVPPSPPPLSPPPSKPSRHLVAQSIGRRYCTAPISSSTASCKDNEPPALPLSGKAPQVHRSNSARSLDASERRVNKESVSRSEMPIPSSDDDCTGGSTQDREHSTSSKRRRTKPAPLRLGEPSLHKVRTGRKSSDHPDPLTPRDPRARMSERTSPQSHHSQSTYYSNDSRGSHSQSSQIIRSLEARIAHLERHNKVLQAALLAALDVGMKENLESVLGGSATSVSTSSMTPATARSFSSTTNSSILDDSAGEDRKSARSKEPPFRPTSWIASPGSSRRSSCESEDSAHVRELEDMMEDFEFDWMSDKEDSARPPALHK